MKSSQNFHVEKFKRIHFYGTLLEERIHFYGTLLEERIHFYRTLLEERIHFYGTLLEELQEITKIETEIQLFSTHRRPSCVYNIHVFTYIIFLYLREAVMI